MKLYLIFDEIKRSEKNIEKQEETCFKNIRMLEIVTVSMIINSDNTKSKLKPK